MAPRTLLGVLGAVAALAVAGCATPAGDRPDASGSSATTLAPGCGDVVVLGLRGQGQSPTTHRGLGAEVEGVATSIAGRLDRTGETTRILAVRHPGRSGVDDAGYAADVARGVRMLRERLRTTRDRCPGTGIVVIGFSEGAKIVHRAAGGGGADAVVLLGDPLQDTPLRPAVEDRSVRVCVDGDVVCRPAPEPRDFTIHRTAYEEPRVGRSVARRVAALLR